MRIARYKDLCIDTVGGETLGRFWAAALGLEFAPDGDSGRLDGPTPRHTVWMNIVPEAKSVKHRMHIDVHTDSVASLERLGATVLEPPTGDRAWTVLADPEGGELCAFVRAEVPDYRLYELNVDCGDPRRLARWWAEAYDAELGGDADSDVWWVAPVPDAPFEAIVFAPVPEPKTGKNRIHLDVTTPDLQSLLDHGATMLRPSGDDRAWHVLADPEGNEFCAFVDARSLDTDAGSAR